MIWKKCAVITFSTILALVGVSPVFADDIKNSSTEKINIEDFVKVSQEEKSIEEVDETSKNNKSDSKSSINTDFEKEKENKNIEIKKNISEDMVKKGNSYIKTTGNLTQIYGDDRYDTAIGISQKGWNYGADTVLLVNGQDVAQGIMASPLASIHNAPILLVDNVIGSNVQGELERLSPSNVILIGDYSKISQENENIIRRITGANVTRFSEQYSRDMSNKIAKEIAKYKNIDTIYLVSPIKGSADALSIAAKAADEKNPIISIGFHGIGDETIEFIKNYNVKNVYYIGGKDSIPSSIVSQVSKIAPNASESNRISGNDRIETNLEVIEKFYKENNYSSLFVAKSDNRGLIDAVTAGPFAEKLHAPILINPKNELSNTYNDFLDEKKASSIYQIGGGISYSVMTTITNKLKTSEVKPEPKPEPEPEPENPNRDKPVILLDAGHGAQDSGAVGIDGRKEKDYTLQTTTYLKTYLQNNGVAVRTMRDNDIFVPLTERSEISNKIKPDLFVSIHFNAANGTANGTEAFYQYNNNFSRKVANNVVNEIASLGLNNRGAKTRTYVDSDTGETCDYLSVLRKTDAPAVLVEGAFMDNEHDMSIFNKLTDLKKLAEKIGRGILNAFK